MSAQAALLPGNRLHFSHGPIDLVIGAEGDAAAVQAAHVAAWERFAGVLPELVAELPLLRAPVAGSCSLRGPVARRMWEACAPFLPRFITPMAAVAGAVADEIVAFYARAGIARAWVNNGGDIALHLAPGESLRVGLSAGLVDAPIGNSAQPSPSDAPAPRIDGRFEVSADLPVRGIATSGWRGRSFSLGIADSVTVLAQTASQADAAATMIANAVNVDDSRIVRRPAHDLKDDSDLHEIMVTVDVPPLGPGQVRHALRAGLGLAKALQSNGLIDAAVLVCQSQSASTGEGRAATDSRRQPFALQQRASASGPHSGTALALKSFAPGWHTQ
jgi:ApbE superfamily uncharacterized protein (UPF0280 family)